MSTVKPDYKVGEVWYGMMSNHPYLIVSIEGDGAALDLRGSNLTGNQPILKILRYIYLQRWPK